MGLLQQAAGRVDVPVEDPLNGWVYVGKTYSACDSERYPFDKDVVAAIREVQPEFIPLVRYSTYQSPWGEEFTWQHHVWARVIREPQASLGKRHATNVLWPTDPTSVNYGWERWAHKLYVQADLGFMGDSVRSPGRTLPIGWNLYHQIKDLEGFARRISQEEEGRAAERRTYEQDKRDRRDADDCIAYQARSGAGVIGQIPTVSVPTNYGSVNE